MIADLLATVAQLTLVAGVITAAVLIRKHHDNTRIHWNDVVMPGASYLLIHLALYSIWPGFWSEWFQSRGFLILQIVAVTGFYTANLDTMQAKVVGVILAGVAVVGLSISIITVIYQIKNTYIAPVGKWSETIEVTPGSILKPERPILIRADDGRILHDNADGLMEPLLEARSVTVQSKDREPVTVTVSR